MITKFLPAIVGAAALFALILDSTHAASWAAEGVTLCIRTVIPTLFPFFVVSAFLTGNLITGKHAGILAKVFGLPGQATPVLLCGFLGGYPVGALTAADRVKKGSLTHSQGKRLLAFCSQAGPSFLFGICGGKFSDPRYPWALWGIQLFSAWLVSRVIPETDTQSVECCTADTTSLSEAMTQALKAMAGVCGWIILFRVILGFCQRFFLWALPEEAQVLFAGLLELTNGCCKLDAIPREEVRFVLCAVLLNFGGLCVLMQTVQGTQVLGIRSYLRGKLLQTLFALLLSLGVVGLIPRFLLIPLLLLPLISGKGGKKSSIPALSGV